MKIDFYKKENAYKDLKIDDKNYSEEQILGLMIKNPDLVQTDS
jgi:hypothetical protein